MRTLAAVLAVVVAVNASTVSDAADGDTIISVFYKVNTVRVRPSARTGSGSVDFRIVLHKNGTVDDAYAVKDGNSGEAKTKLGKQPRSFVYRIVDATTIGRTTELETHFHKLAVRVDGKNCKADVAFILKPGQSEFKDYSTELKQMAYFSSLKTEYVTCVIE